MTQAGYPELPVVLSDHHDFLQASYYASGEWSRRFVDVVDPRAAAIFAGTDNGDKNLLVLRLFSPIQVYQYESFAAAHPKFLLYSGEGDWDWWPARLLHDGDSLQLVAMKERRKVYLVTLVPSPGLAEGNQADSGPDMRFVGGAPPGMNGTDAGVPGFGGAGLSARDRGRHQGVNCEWGGKFLVLERSVLPVVLRKLQRVHDLKQVLASDSNRNKRQDCPH